MQLLNAREPHPSPNLRGPRGPDSALWQTCQLNAACCSSEVNALAPDLHWHKRHLGTNKVKALQDALLSWESQWKEIPSWARSSNAGAKHMAPPQLCPAGQKQHLSQHVNTDGEKSPPSLFLLSCSARQSPLSGGVKQKEAVCVGSCWGPGSCRAGGCVGSCWPSRSASLPERGGLGNWEQGANETEAKGFSEEVAFLLQTNSIRNILMETCFVTPTQPDRTKGAYMTCCHVTS